ncbi:Glioma pathogenesis-related protein 1 [Lamellibrachia satsuma]|nr:Glioma pathogenesis-related protein 1 [Lamellibrachia satsuma]
MSSTLLALVALACLAFQDLGADDVDLQEPYGQMAVTSPLLNGTRPLFRARRALVRDTDKHDVTAQERIAALKKHNELRGKVSPSATKMIHMRWNWKLAEMAQEWADGCQYKHGQPKRDKLPFPQIGQNLWVHTGGHDIEAAVQVWYDEVNDYDYNANTCNKVCGHYTQVVWANTREVGCGTAYCTKTVGFKDRAAYYIVCNYGPAGNYVGQKPYESGTSCSKCPADHPKCDDKLCREFPPCKTKDCLNGGTVDTATCECKCSGDYKGSSCESGAVGDCIGEMRVLTMLLSLLISESRSSGGSGTGIDPSTETTIVLDKATTFIQGNQTTIVPDKETTIVQDKQTTIVPNKKTNIVQDKQTTIVPDKETTIVQDKQTTIGLDKKPTTDLNKGTDIETKSGTGIVVMIGKGITEGGSHAEKLGDWSEWSTCSVTCGNKGVKLRHRQCEDTNGECGQTQRVHCEAPPCEDTPMFFSFEMSFVLPNRKFDPLLADYKSDLYTELQRNISNLLLENSSRMKIYAVRNVTFAKGSIVVECDLVTSDQTTVDDVRQVMLKIATNESMPIAIEETSISVSEPVEIVSYEEPVGIDSYEDHGVDVCASRPCQNGGNCIDLTTRYTCLCREGYSGARCETALKYYNGWPCLGEGCLVDELEIIRKKLNNQPEFVIKVAFIITCTVLAIVFFILICLLVVKCSA